MMWSAPEAFVDTVYTQGIPLQNGIQNINNTTSVKDKVIFQWSPELISIRCAQSTFQLLKDLDLWDHYEFDDFRQFSFYYLIWRRRPKLPAPSAKVQVSTILP